MQRPGTCQVTANENVTDDTIIAAIKTAGYDAVVEPSKSLENALAPSG